MSPDSNPLSPETKLLCPDSDLLCPDSKFVSPDSNLLSPNTVKFAEHIDLRHLRINRGRTDPQMAQMHADTWGSEHENDSYRLIRAIGNLRRLPFV